MSYIDGLIIAVPTANKQKFIDHAKLGDSVFMDLGATRILECWMPDDMAGPIPHVVSPPSSGQRRR